ncbi:O-antigen ligase family protein [Parasphingorhabdus sp.]|uniref:O-antigen ligase family protein n=1 Tax=Parasphingorhabdus sp. TaxID=2709688 RepID=UPI002B26CC8E|nr:O-antigen ligase family protein [Parasphingorhabdus sp.]
MNDKKINGAKRNRDIMDRAPLFVLGAFVAVICLLGGSARGDAAQLVFLRPICCLFAGYGIYRLGSQKVKGLMPLYAGIGFLASLMILQMIPLPYAIWSELPGREVVVNLDVAGGLTDLWRSISLSSSRTGNSLASLIVPLAAMLLFHIYPNHRKKDLLAVIIIIAAGNAMLGILQLLGPSGGALYFYEFTNPSDAVGFFANRNHSSVFSGLSLLIISYFYAQRWQVFRFSGAYTNIFLATVYIVIFLSIIINGSRAGLLCGGIALFVGLIIFNLQPPEAARHKRARVNKIGSIIGSIAIFMFSATLILLFFVSDRLPAVSRLLERDTMSDLRAKAMPTLFEMIGTYWPVGTGFGTFDKVYFIHERSELLMSSYFNQAHNDWLQILIEGGAPVAILAVVGILWYIASVLKLFLSTSRNLSHLFFWFGIMAILAIASLVDYPLRTPIFSAVTVWMVAFLFTARHNLASFGISRQSIDYGYGRQSVSR